MDEQQIARLTARVHRLEQQVRDLQSKLGVAAEPARPPRSFGAQRVEAERVRASEPTPAQRDEADVIGAWFARVGAIALVIGLAFAFKYSIDRGFIGPAARVSVGVVFGAALLGASEWAARRRWRAWAQAVAGGGIAIIYLSILAAVQLYALLPGATAFVLLVVTTALAAWLALRHDSLALAVLAALGAYTNAVLLKTQASRPAFVLVYLLAVNAGILALAFFRRWRELDALALAGSIVVFGLNAADASFQTEWITATVLVAIFTAVPVVRIGRGARTDAFDFAFLLASSVIYGSYMLTVLDANGLDHFRGLFTIAMALAYALLSYAVARRDERLSRRVVFVAAGYLAAFVPVEFPAVAVPPGWAGAGVIFLVAARALRVETMRVAGTGFLALSLAAMPAVSEHLVPTRTLLSGQAAAFVIVIVGLALGAALLRDDHAPLPEWTSLAAAVAAIVVLLAWAMTEVATALDRGGATDQAKQFSLTAVLASFATVLLATGLVLRTRWLRLAGVALFAIVVAKLALVDIWTLSTAYRVFAFSGIGAALLVCSLGYQRLRQPILGTDEGEG